MVFAPVTEEFAKGLFLVLVFWLRPAQLHGVVDSIVYACLAGIGFAYTEDVLYYSSALTDGGPNELAATVVIRGCSVRSRIRCSRPRSVSASALR